MTANNSKTVLRSRGESTHFIGEQKLGPGLRRGNTRFSGAGFTLIEILLVMTLMAAMMGMIYASLNVGVRAWDAGDARVSEASDLRVVERFMRRELGQIFPTRWRGVAQPYIAFEGSSTSLRYVTSLNLEASLQNGAAGGLQWAELALAEGGVLQLNRQPFDSAAQNFDALVSPTRDQLNGLSTAAPPAPPVRLMDNVTDFEISYFGAETDIAEPTWREEWRDLARLPTLIRIKVATNRGRDTPDMVFALKVGEEAGCLASNFTRQCGPRAR
jgi:general secretion pathway protein J